MLSDDHRLALGAVGFMRHDYVNFGFDRADVIVAAGYELQEFDPVRINPDGDTKIIHIHRFPAEVDAHYDVAVGLLGDIGGTLDALATRVDAGSPVLARSRTDPRTALRRAGRRTRRRQFPAGARPHRRRHASSDGTAMTSSWSIPAHSRCGWPGSIRPMSRTPA